MTPEQVGLVQDSFRKIIPIAGKAAELFYDRLFEIAPETRSLFKNDLTGQYDKLIQMLVWVVANLNRAETILPAVEELGRRHARYEVEPEHYGQVGEALIWTLEQGLGDDFTPNIRDAWIAAYGLLAQTMQSAAATTPASREALTKPMLEGVCTAVYGAIGWQESRLEYNHQPYERRSNAPDGIDGKHWWR